MMCFFFSSRRRHTRFDCDWSSDVCSSDLGGTHLSGFRTALTRALTAYGNKQNLFKNITPQGEDFREGITAIVSIAVPEPQFEDRKSTRLNSSHSQISYAVFCLKKKK